MKKLLLAMIVAASPAVAWDNTNNGRGPNQIVDGGPGAQATARARASSASRSTATGGNARSGNVTGGNVNVTNSNGGGGGGYGNGGDNYVVTTPDGHGMAPCGGGLGLGAVIASFGGTLWEFRDCKIMREAAMLRSMGYHDAATAELCQIDRILKAFGGTCPTSGTRVDAYPFDYCQTRNAGDANQHKECEQRVTR